MFLSLLSWLRLLSNNWLQCFWANMRIWASLRSSWSWGYHRKIQHTISNIRTFIVFIHRLFTHRERRHLRRRQLTVRRSSCLPSYRLLKSFLNLSFDIAHHGIRIPRSLLWRRISLIRSLRVLRLTVSHDIQAFSFGRNEPLRGLPRV
jgi:hypothetical protein